MSTIVKALLITACFTFLITNFSTAKSRIDIESDTYVVSQDLEVLPHAVSSYLLQQNKERVKVWVFFRDKGFSDKAGFNQMASSVQLSEKVLARRKKVNLDKVLFVDLPVYDDYVNQKIGRAHV